MNGRAKNSELFLIFFFFISNSTTFATIVVAGMMCGSRREWSNLHLKLEPFKISSPGDSREDFPRNFTLQSCSKSIPGLCSSVHIKLSSSAGNRVRN